MNRKIELTDEELQELDFLVKREWRSSEVELNHTRAFAYKEVLKDRIKLLEELSPKLSGFTPMPKVMAGSRPTSPDGVRHHSTMG